MRLIDADALVLRFVPKQAYFTDHILEKIDTAPAVDAAPVAHGYWDLSFRCSECGCENDRETRFCPNCGAKMDLEE